MFFLLKRCEERGAIILLIRCESNDTIGSHERVSGLVGLILDHEKFEAVNACAALNTNSIGYGSASVLNIAPFLFGLAVCAILGGYGSGTIISLGDTAVAVGPGDHGPIRVRCEAHLCLLFIASECELARVYVGRGTIR